MRVCVVGVGALGSHVALFARNWDVALYIIDFDKVEAKNVQSQFHTAMGLRRNKALAFQQTMQGLYQRDVKATSAKLSKDNVQQLLGPNGLVIDCTDNAEARTLIQCHCGVITADLTTDPAKPLESAIPCLHGCLSADGSLARAVWTEHFTVDGGGDGGATCEDGQNLPFHGMAGGLIAQVAQRFLETGEKKSWQLTASSLLRIA